MTSYIKRLYLTVCKYILNLDLNFNRYYLSYLLKVSSQFGSFYFYFLCFTCKQAGEVVLTKAKCIYTDLT